MQDLNDLYFYAQVVEHGGFAAAERALGIPRSKLSRRIAQLEEKLGVRLIQRSSRQFSVTPLGQEYFKRCQAVLVEAESASTFIAEQHAEPQGIIRVSCPTALLSAEFGKIFGRFLVKYPKVKLHLESTDRRVDPIAEKIDIAIRVRFPPLEHTDLMMRKLDESGQYLVAAPDFFDTRPRTPDDLHGVPSLGWKLDNNHYAWNLLSAENETRTINHTPRYISESHSALLDAAVAGAGIVQLPSMVVWRAISDGKVIPLLQPGWVIPAGIVHAVFPSRRGLLPSVRALLDFMTEECSHERRKMDRYLPPSPLIQP